MPPICMSQRYAAPVALLLLAMIALPVRAADPCDGFTWPVARERTLFAGGAAATAAGRAAATAPRLKAGHLYQLQLAAQTAVAFAVEPGKKRLTDGAHAGLARFKVRQQGRYRISASADVWIDVVTDRQLVPSRDFRGMQGCQTPHKIVEYDLRRAGTYVLQLSGGAADSVAVAITPAPPTAAAPLVVTPPAAGG